MITRRVRVPRHTVAEAVRTHPRLKASVEHIARQARIPEEVVHRHLSEAMHSVLEAIGDVYVAELGDAVRHLEIARTKITDFYESVLDGREPHPDPAKIAPELAAVRQGARDLADPQAWAKRVHDDAVASERVRREAAARTHEQTAASGPHAEAAPGAVASPKPGEKAQPGEKGSPSTKAQPGKKARPNENTSHYGEESLSSAQRRAILDEGAAALGLPQGSRIAAEMAQASKTLRRIAADSPEHFMDLAYGWLDCTAKAAAEGRHPQTLRTYIMALMRRHVKGMLGEFTATFQLGPDFWVLKAPDRHVTQPGTDFVVVSKRSGEIWFCDNKAIRDHSLGRVSSLVENISANMADDVATFGPIVRDLAFPVPEPVVAAIGNAQRASEQISALVHGMTGEQVRSLEVQQQITYICDVNGVRRVVTNAGGHLSELSLALRGLGIDFANLDGITALPEQPILWKAPP